MFADAHKFNVNMRIVERFSQWVMMKALIIITILTSSKRKVMRPTDQNTKLHLVFRLPPLILP
jgi:hypothetical protein